MGLSCNLAGASKITRPISEPRYAIRSTGPAWLSCSQRAVTLITWPSIRPTIGCTVLDRPSASRRASIAPSRATAGLHQHLSRSARDRVAAVDDSARPARPAPGSRCAQTGNACSRARSRPRRPRPVTRPAPPASHNGWTVEIARLDPIRQAPARRLAGYQTRCHTAR